VVLFHMTWYAGAMAKLSVVATPIGNLEDITLRALRVLEECAVVLCEDTRVTGKLLKHYAIKKPLLSYHDHSGHAKYEKVYTLLEGGSDLALVSDAGTPAVSDPGALLVAAVRECFGEAVCIEAIPGPSALSAALSIAGLQGDTFTFCGFPPHKKGRETFFRELLARREVSVFYESPHRIVKALTALAADETRHVIVLRELTKIHEEVRAGTARELCEHFLAHPDTVRGEFVVIVV